MYDPVKRTLELYDAETTLDMIRDYLKDNKNPDGSIKTYKAIVETVKMYVELHYERED